MKFTVNTKVFKDWLDVVNHATASVTTTPILENILIKVNYNSVVLTSNNLELAIEYVITENVVVETEWSFCLPSKLLTSFIGLLEDDTVSLEKQNDWSVKVSTSSSNMKIKWVVSEDFPIIPWIKWSKEIVIKWSLLKTAFEKTLFSSAEWNIRPTLAWVYMNISWNIAKFASTDSFRLTKFAIPLDESIDNSASQIIPSKTAYELKSIIGSDNVKIIIWDNQIGFFYGHTKVYSRLLNGQFPDFEWFFPTSFNTRCVVNKYDLVWALKKINLISKETNYSIKMSFSNEWWILLETNETQIWESKINLVWSIEWVDNIIWINSTYFLEVLWVIETSHISISFETSLNPILIQPISDEDKPLKNEFKHILMPLKI